MYRIELGPGEETAFRTIEELAVGIRNGLVTGRARIYHTATQKWLPIEFHPHYKKALELSTQRQEIPAMRVPDKLETLSFAVLRPAPASTEPSAPAAAAPEPVAPAAPPPAPTAPVEAPARAPVALAAPIALKPIAPEPIAPEPIEPEPIAPWPVASTVALSPLSVAVEPEVEPAPVIRTRVEFPALQALAEEASAEAEARERMPRPVASPVAQFQPIIYPEITPADPPVAEPSTESARSRRPLHVAGAIVVLALGGYGMLSFAPSRNAAAAIPATDERPAPAPSPEPSPARTAGSGEGRLATPASSTPRTVTMTGPASSGFAPALEPRAIVGSTPEMPEPPTPAPVKDSLVAPAPVAVDLDMPVIAGADSLLVTPRPTGDSAMKRILRAVNGGKEAPAR